MEKQRTVEEIDADLHRAVDRRRVGKARIEALSDCIIADTRWIDRLLAERSAACVDRLADVLLS